MLSHIKRLYPIPTPINNNAFAFAPPKHGRRKRKRTPAHTRLFRATCRNNSKNRGRVDDPSARRREGEQKKMPGASRDGAAASTRSVSPFSLQELRPHASLRISWLCPVAASTLCADCEPRIFPRLFHPLYLHTAVCIYIIHAWNVYATFDSRTGRDSTWSDEKKVPRATEFSASDICEFAPHRARQTGRRHLCAIVLGFFRGRKRIVRALIRFHVPLRVGGFGG